MTATVLTPGLARCLRLIWAFYTKNGFAPSVREISQGLGGTSTGNVYRMTESLTGRGYLQKIPGVGRGLQLTPEGNLWCQRFAEGKSA